MIFTCLILGVFVNTSDADDKYLVLSNENLTIPVKIKLSTKQKAFSEFYAAFLKSRLHFEYFEKKDDLHRFYISQVTDSENVVR